MITKRLNAGKQVALGRVPRLLPWSGSLARVNMSDANVAALLRGERVCADALLEAWRETFADVGKALGHDYGGGERLGAEVGRLCAHWFIAVLVGAPLVVYAPEPRIRHIAARYVDLVDTPGATLSARSLNDGSAEFDPLQGARMTPASLAAALLVLLNHPAVPDASVRAIAAVLWDCTQMSCQRDSGAAGTEGVAFAMKGIPDNVTERKKLFAEHCSRVSSISNVLRCCVAWLWKRYVRPAVTVGEWTLLRLLAACATSAPEAVKHLQAAARAKKRRLELGDLERVMQSAQLLSQVIAARAKGSVIASMIAVARTSVSAAVAHTKARGGKEPDRKELLDAVHILRRCDACLFISYALAFMPLGGTGRAFVDLLLRQASTLAHELVALARPGGSIERAAAAAPAADKGAGAGGVLPPLKFTCADYGLAPPPISHIVDLVNLYACIEDSQALKLAASFWKDANDLHRTKRWPSWMRG